MKTTIRRPLASSRPHLTVDPAAPATDRRVRAYRIVVLAVVVLVLTGPGGAVGLLAPWSTIGQQAGPSFELHRWHAADIAAYASLLVALPLVASLRRPRASVTLVQTALVGALWLAVLAPLMPAPGAALVPAVAVAALIIGSFPDRRSLGHIPDRSGPWSSRAAALGASPFLTWNAYENLGRQLAGTGAHAELGHWAGGAALALTLLVAGRLAAASGDDSRRLAIVLGAAYGYLGAAALTLPVSDGSWGTAGGVLALAMTVLFLLPRGRRAPGEADR